MMMRRMIAAMTMRRMKSLLRWTRKFPTWTLMMKFTLKIKCILIDDAGVYECNVMNSRGGAATTTKLNVLNVLPPAGTPTLAKLWCQHTSPEVRGGNSASLEERPGEGHLPLHLPGLPEDLSSEIKSHHTCPHIVCHQIKLLS